jgi:hypothetical protein
MSGGGLQDGSSKIDIEHLNPMIAFSLRSAPYHGTVMDVVGMFEIHPAIRESRDLHIQASATQAIGNATSETLYDTPLAPHNRIRLSLNVHSCLDARILSTDLI